MVNEQTTQKGRSVLATATGASFYAPLINYEAQPLRVSPMHLPGSAISLRRPPQPKDLTSTTIPLSSNLSEKVLGDVVIGCGVTLTVTPFLTIVDKAIVQRAAGTHSLFSSVSQSTANMIRNPVSFFRNPAFLLMWSVYAATYSTANSLKTIVEHKNFLARKQREEQRWFSIDEQKESSSARQNQFSVFIGTTLVNSAASLWKDRAYAKMFGTTGAAPKVPFITMGLWATRDCLVVYSSFILPDLASEWIHETYPSIALQDAKRASQFSVPILTQFVAGPIQLLGLDFYNRPLANLSMWEAAANRTRFLARGFVSVVTARIARIAPGYGIGGVLNTQWRDGYRDYLIEQEMKEMMVGGVDDQPETYRLVKHVTARHHIQ